MAWYGATDPFQLLRQLRQGQRGQYPMWRFAQALLRLAANGANDLLRAGGYAAIAHPAIMRGTPGQLGDGMWWETLVINLLADGGHYLPTTPKLVDLVREHWGVPGLDPTRVGDDVAVADYSKPGQTAFRDCPWRTPLVQQLADTALASDYSAAALGVLADALEEAGCTERLLLGHLRGQVPLVTPRRAHIYAQAPDGWALHITSAAAMRPSTAVFVHKRRQRVIQEAEQRYGVQWTYQNAHGCAGPLPPLVTMGPLPLPAHCSGCWAVHLLASDAMSPCPE